MGLKGLRLKTFMYRFLRNPLLCVLLLCVFLAGSLFYFSPFRAPNAHASGLVPLVGQVPGLARKSRLLGPADPATQVMLLLGLRMRNQAALQAYVDNLSRPHSITAGHYLTPAQVATAYGPSSESQQAVVAFMQAAGFQETLTFKHHLLLGFKGTIGQAEAAFHVQINDYRARDGRQFYAPASDPLIPDALSPIIQSINGLDNAAHFTHPPVPARKGLQTAATTATTGRAICPGSGSNGSYFIPAQIARAYNLNGLYNVGFRGEGQIVGLFELDDYLFSDIKTYTACYGGGSVPINRVLVDGGTGQPPSDGAIEVELDMEMVLSAAPHLASLRVYEAANTDSEALAEWSQIVSDATPVVSTSWGQCDIGIASPGYASEENTLFLEAAAQGQSIFAASGDSGTNDCGDGSRTVDDPAAQPYITGVGGTTLTLSSGHYGSEVVWDDTSRGYASGGGISADWTMPSWQQGPGVENSYSSAEPCAANTGNTGKLCREVPDVSLNADPNTGYATYCTAGSSCVAPNTGWIVVGGTSAAAPLWAAMTALANEKSLHDGNFNLGFLNPLLYEIGQNESGTSYASDFHDITSGTNDPFGDGQNIYPATTGYDMTTGLGSYNALALASDLEKLAKALTNSRSAPASTKWYFAEGSVGNSFHEYLTLLNPGATQAATVTITYLFSNKAPVTVQHTVSASTRSTVDVNADLHVALSDPQQAISAIVSSNIPIVAERPLYFDLHGIASGTDVLGATGATHTTFYFAEGDSRQSGNASYATYVTILNPSQSNTAHVVITYYSNGGVAGTQNVNVGPMQRGTGTPAAPGLHEQVAIKVTSDIGIVVERPLYFKDFVPTAGGWTSGAASAVGATSLGSGSGSDWLFAEGYTGNGNNFQEYLVLANFTGSAASVNVKLEYTNGTVQTVPVTVNAESQYYFDVNNAYAHPQSGCGCTPTPEVSAEVTASTASIVAERLMYFHYGPKHIPGGSDVVGEAGPASQSVYSFAEGYTYGDFSEFLTLQNPTNNVETVAITLFADNTIVQETLQLAAHSRTTVSINSLIVPMARAYPTTPVTQGFEVSMDIQALNGGTVVAERPLYFILHGDMGGTDVIGYTGG
jgi:kumamolisin